MLDAIVTTVYHGNELVLAKWSVARRITGLPGGGGSEPVTGEAGGAPSSAPSGAQSGVSNSAPAPAAA